MQVDRELFMEQGFLILRDFIPRDKLDAIRASAEIMLERQKEIWRRERKPGDPPGGEWETARQPRVMMELPGIIDEQTANVVEDFWIDDATLEVVGQLITGEPMIHSMMMMCSPPVEDHPGGTGWHRDFSALRTAPLAALQADLIENGPRYTQWNVPLYDDNVLWIVPGSHRRLNTPEEDAALRRSTKEPVPGGVAVELRAGDAAVYSHYLLHWGSNYTTRLRRTLHGGHVTLAEFDDLSFAEGLSRRGRATFERWSGQGKALQEATEAALRAVIAGDAAAYHAGLETLEPGIGEQGKTLFTIFLCKAARQIKILQDSTFEAHDLARSFAGGSHPLTLNWGPGFSKRFTAEEGDALWRRFAVLDAQLQVGEDQDDPGFQQEHTPYLVNTLPESVHTEAFIASWRR